MHHCRLGASAACQTTPAAVGPGHLDLGEVAAVGQLLVDLAVHRLAAPGVAERLAKPKYLRN